jgi:outer membrane protein assembly factor BamA
MLKTVRAAVLAASCVAQVAAAPVPRTYILNGYSLRGVQGVDEDALVATLKHKEGDHITRADITADTDTISKALKERHIEGRLFATIAEKDGRAWVLFDFQYPQLPQESAHRWLGAQIFDGNVEISSATLEAATGLKPGDDLPVERVSAARQAILEAYKKAAPGKDVHVGGKIRVTPGGKVELTWRITEAR